MWKLLLIPLLVVVAVVIAGLYGIVHDQLTYSISYEYYTLFKFPQFGLDFVGRNSEHPRIWVAVVGFFATWWTGIPIGLVTAIVSIQKRNKQMVVDALKGYLITISVAIFVGFVGFLCGRFYFSSLSREQLSGWYLPDDVTDFESFVTVGSVHNFSYVGGLIGLVVACYYILKRKRSSAQDLKPENQLD